MRIEKAYRFKSYFDRLYLKSMSRKKVTAKNFEKVLDNMKEMFNDLDQNYKKIMCNDLNDMLDMQFENDFFGTEGQLDPRGDARD